MADIRPFQGIHYNSSLLREWTKVICPVYDIIPAGYHETLYAASPYNFVRLEAGRELPQDTPEDNRYTRAAATLREWLSNGILVTDPQPAIYMHDHYFAYGGKHYKRRGIIARVRLEEWDKMIIRPHESTFAEARSDRLSLIWAIQANTSSILSLFEDKEGRIKETLESEEMRPPAMDLLLDGEEGHRVWAITDPEVLSAIEKAFASQPLYIADGHHRYESALAYRRQRRAVSSPAGDQPYDFVMMTLVEFDDPGLLILPPHRLIRGVPKAVLDGFRSRLEVFFAVQELGLEDPSAWSRVDAARRSNKSPVLVLYGVKPGRILLLEPKNMEGLFPMMPQFHSELYKRLEVSIIDHVILDRLLELDHEKEKVNVGYSYERQDAISRVTTGEYQMCFLIEPIRATVIKSIADVSDKMPKKSTYFYPKVPAGLLVNRLV